MKLNVVIGFNSLLKRVVALILGTTVCIAAFGQEEASYSILVAGHAYGAHAGTNLGLHPPFIKKLQEKKDTTISALFLTGDIINRSTTASWAQVENELSDIGFPSYYIMGNHDNNTIGKAIFQAKHGSLYYSFILHNDLYVILNSTESDCSISNAQLVFLTDKLHMASVNNRRVFIFFHEVIWNSHEKYRLVRSNIRSRYGEIKEISNFWQRVVPIIDTYPNKEFYLFAGDVGGRPDAIAASYDRWNHMTLLSSGMGEVPDENYMRVDVSSDTVSFTLIPLNDEIQMKPINWYNIPDSPQHITGPEKVNPPELLVKYEVPPVFNTTSYRWTLSSGIVGSSDSAVANLSFDGQFQTGQLTVRAVNDGFGESDPVTLNVQSSDDTSIADNESHQSISILQNQQSIKLNYSSDRKATAQIKIAGLSGNLLIDRTISINQGLNTIKINKQLLSKGIIILNWTLDNMHFNKKIVIY